MTRPSSQDLASQDLAPYLEWIDPLNAIARDAGAAIMDIYAGDIAIRNKDDQSPVTDADEAAEKIILAGLRTLAPTIPVVAEESMAAGQRPEIAGDLFWLVDPLDGTKEFIRRQGQFTVNIALIYRDQPILGVVYAPALGDLYAGVVGHGAWRWRDQAKADIHVRTADTAALIAVASKSHRTPETDSYLSQLAIADSRAAGSSLKFCLVADGSADLYPRFGPTMEWDTAAGHAVLAAAGGAVLSPDGTPLCYGKPDFRNGFFFAIGDLAWDAIKP